MKSKKLNYFDAFIQFSQKACEAATMLNECFSAFAPENVPAHMDRIHAVEHEADQIRHTVIEQLSHEFVAPIEREDIFDLVQQFDEVVDSIDEVIRKVGMFRLQSLRDDVMPFTQLLCQGCQQLSRVTVEFTDFKRSKTIRDGLIEINHIEAQADTLHYNAIYTLFSDNADAAHLVAWKSIYDTLENCFDSCEHAADVIESVILKNS